MIEPEFYITKADSLYVRFPKEPPMRARLLEDWIHEGMSLDLDLNRALEEFARVEAGESEISVGTLLTTSYVSKERVRLEQAYFSSPEEEAHPASTELSFAEAKELILRWRDALEAFEKSRGRG